jgi:hypothetical protein
MDGQARRIDFHIFANRFERAPIGTHPGVAPYSAGVPAHLEVKGRGATAAKLAQRATQCGQARFDLYASKANEAFEFSFAG